MLVVPAFLGMLLFQSGSQAPDLGPVIREIQTLQREVIGLGVALKQRDDSLAAMRKDVASMGDEIGALRAKVVVPVAAPFLSGPPPSTDAVGYAKVAVFAPMVVVDSARRHDLVSLHVKRVEAGAIRHVANIDLLGDDFSVALPLDQNGALYIVDWFTSEGQSFSLLLRDGAGGPEDLPQPAATVQVKQLQRQGRFVFVGYRAD
jgi:hypothetical protein